MDKKKIQFDNIDKRLKKLRQVFFDSNNLQEDINSYDYMLDQLEFDIEFFENKYGFDEADELFNKLIEIKNFIKNHFVNQDRKTQETLNFMFEDELENNDFPDSFDMDDFFDLD